MEFKRTHKGARSFFDINYQHAADTDYECDKAWINGIRKNSQDIFFGEGYPTRKNELWKYTSLRKASETSFTYGGSYNEDGVQQQISEIPRLSNSLRVVFVNGQYQKIFSDTISDLKDGVSLSPLSQVLKKEPDSLRSTFGVIADPADSFTYAMNTSFVSDGLCLSVAKGVNFNTVLHVISIGSVGSNSTSFHPRLEILLEDGAKATILETHCGGSDDIYMSNSLSEIKLCENAALDHYTTVIESANATHIGGAAVFVGKNSFYNSFIFLMGGGLVRREVNVRLESPDARTNIDGIYCIARESHSDIVSEVKHIGINTVSKQDIRGVLGGKSHGVFQGNIYVDASAQGSDGDLLHKALFLNRGPEVDVKPQLEIFADDVKCSHGATTGELDSKQLFYLLSRGIDEGTARSLLISGFLNDVALHIENAEVCSLISELISQWLHSEVNLKEVIL